MAAGWHQTRWQGGKGQTLRYSTGRRIPYPTRKATSGAPRGPARPPTPVRPTTLHARPAELPCNSPAHQGRRLRYSAPPLAPVAWRWRRKTNQVRQAPAFQGLLTGQSARESPPAAGGRPEPGEARRSGIGSRPWATREIIGSPRFRKISGAHGFGGSGRIAANHSGWRVKARSSA